MTKPPVVSVLMPVYNAERYVAEAVESILTQTFTDFEFLIVDDGSSDGTPEVLRRYEKSDSRVRLTIRTNLGLVPTLNEMLGAARGEFIARMDADDVALPHRLNDQFVFLRQHPEVVCVGGSYVRIDEKGRRVMTISFKQDHESMEEQALSGICPVAHPTVMMRRDSVLAVGGYDDRWYYAEDLDLWLRLGERGRLANLQDVILKYRVHEKSRTWEDVERQAACMTNIVEEAYNRRGLDRQIRIRPLKAPGHGRLARHEYASMCSYWSLREGERRTSLEYAARAISLAPWRPEGWKRLARSLTGI